MAVKGPAAVSWSSILLYMTGVSGIGTTSMMQPTDRIKRLAKYAISLGYFIVFPSVIR